MSIVCGYSCNDFSLLQFKSFTFYRTGLCCRYLFKSVIHGYVDQWGKIESIPMSHMAPYDGTIFECFLNSLILFRLFSKLVHTLTGHILCTLHKFTDKNNVTYVCMTTKYPIIKCREFFKTHTFCMSANNEDICLKFLPDTYDHILTLYIFVWPWKVKVQGHAKDILV